MFGGPGRGRSATTVWLSVWRPSTTLISRRLPTAIEPWLLTARCKRATKFPHIGTGSSAIQYRPRLCQRYRTYLDVPAGPAWVRRDRAVEPIVQAKNDTREDFLGTRHSLLSNFLYFFCPNSVTVLWGICVYRCPRRNVPDFGRVFLRSNYTDITHNTYVQSWTVTEIMAREVWNFDSCYTLIDYQILIKTGMNMWFL